MAFQNYEIINNQFKCYIDCRIYKTTNEIPNYGSWSVFSRDTDGYPTMYWGDNDTSLLPTDTILCPFLKNAPKAITLDKIVYVFNINNRTWEALING